MAGAAFKHYRLPGTVIARFSARRTAKSSAVWAYIFGAFVASKALAYAKTFPDLAARAKIAHAFSGNVGLVALLGQPHHLETVSGFTAWNAFSVITIIGSVWALTLATRYFRGEEVSGRSELLLTGQTTQRRAAYSTLVGLCLGLVLQFVIMSVVFIVIGRQHSVDFTASNCLFFALASLCGAAMFMAIGALASQIMPTRTRAAGLATLIFGLSLIVRAMADITSLHWLLNLSPLGWIEKLQPLSGSQPVWLVPIAILILVCAALTVYLAGRRDLGASLLADRDTARPRLRLLGSPMGAAIRFTRGPVLSWLAAIWVLGLFYGLLTKSAAQAFATATQSPHAHKVFDRLTHASQLGAGTAYVGVIFFLLMPIVMSYVASALGKVREDEAEGYLDNFLVGPVSRLRWLGGRLGLVLVTLALVCLAGGLGVWIGEASQHIGLGFHSLVLASVNIMAPAVFTLGVAMLSLGFVPRATTVVAYSVAGWSFLVYILASGLNLNHWFRDSSLFQHVSFAPAVSPNWHSDLIIFGLGIALGLLGIWRFSRRDLQTE